VAEAVDLYPMLPTQSKAVDEPICPHCNGDLSSGLRVVRQEQAGVGTIVLLLCPGCSRVIGLTTEQTYSSARALAARRPRA